MSKIHYFQRYSQRENVVTNNTLLLFSRLYNYSPIRFNEFLNQLLDGNPQVNVGLNIVQQSRATKGRNIPDGVVSQDEFQILIETKLDDKYSKDQIKRHLDSFPSAKTQVLLLVAPKKIKLENRKEKKSVIYCQGITFEEIIKNFESVLSVSDFEMKDILEDYASFCDEQKLLSMSKYTLRIVPCGVSLDTNLKYDMYYAPSDRSYREFDYLGVYKNLKVQAVGKVIKIVDVVMGLNTFEEIKGKLTSTEKDKILKMIKEANRLYQHCVEGQTLRFFIVDKFCKVNFKKQTPGGIQNHRYVDLRDYFGDKSNFNSVEEICRFLDNSVWG